MSKTPTRREHEAASDIFLAPGDGGVMIWCRRDELKPRASIRFRGQDMPIEEAVALVACLRKGYEQISRQLAQAIGIDEDAFEQMVDTGYEAIKERMATDVFKTPSHTRKIT